MLKDVIIKLLIVTIFNNSLSFSFTTIVSIKEI